MAAAFSREQREASLQPGPIGACLPWLAQTMHLSYPVLKTGSHSQHASRAAGCPPGLWGRVFYVLCWGGVLCVPVIQAYAETETLSPQCFLLPRLGKTYTEIYGEIGQRK